jgi:hypothetical protein
MAAAGRSVTLTVKAINAAQAQDGYADRTAVAQRRNIPKNLDDLKLLGTRRVGADYGNQNVCACRRV